MTTDTRNLRLSLEGRLVDRLSVVSFRGAEEANRLYRIDVDFTTDATDDHLEERLLDRGATLSVLDGGVVARMFHGVAGAVTAHGLYQHDRRAYRLSLVPRMSRLKLRRTRRVWTDVSSLDVAATLFREHGVVHRTRIAEAPPRRPYSRPASSRGPIPSSRRSAGPRRSTTTGAARSRRSLPRTGSR